MSGPSWRSASLDLAAAPRSCSRSSVPTFGISRAIMNFRSAIVVLHDGARPHVAARGALGVVGETCRRSVLRVTSTRMRQRHLWQFSEPAPAALARVCPARREADGFHRRSSRPTLAEMSTLLITHPACLEHVTPLGHPERPDRLRAIERAFEAEKFQSLARVAAPLAELETVALCHPMDYIVEIRDATPREGLVRLDADTSMSPGTFEAALRAVGGAVH